MALFRPVRIAALIAVVALAAGCATARDSRDPWEPVNRVTFEINETLDHTILKPVAMGYKFVLPGPIRTWVSNFFSNANDVVVLANDLLQFKWLQARDDATRLFINTTVGLFGINDVASDIGLEKHNEDLGQTFALWGVGPGPYFVIPILGASTVRDGFGLLGDIYMNPVFDIENVSTRNALIALGFVNLRATLLEAGTVIDEAAIDKYSFVRDAYLQRRLNLIYDGNPPRKYEDDGESDAPPPAKDSDAPGAPAPDPKAGSPSPVDPADMFEPKEPASFRSDGLPQPEADSRDSAAPKAVRLWLPGTVY
jgi:phospholipid-binding lipoprotein MlaA